MFVIFSCTVEVVQLDPNQAAPSCYQSFRRRLGRPRKEAFEIALPDIRPQWPLRSYKAWGQPGRSRRCYLGYTEEAARPHSDIPRRQRFQRSLADGLFQRKTFLHPFLRLRFLSYSSETVPPTPCCASPSPAPTLPGQPTFLATSFTDPSGCTTGSPRIGLPFSPSCTPLNLRLGSLSPPRSLCLFCHWWPHQEFQFLFPRKRGCLGTSPWSLPWLPC